MAPRRPRAVNAALKGYRLIHERRAALKAKIISLHNSGVGVLSISVRVKRTIPYVRKVLASEGLLDPPGRGARAA
jgi:hypothetical protein